MNIEILENFLALSRSLNFTKTSRELHIAQSTLSTQIQKLEKDVGSRLIDRSDCPRLTPAGRELVEIASNIVSLYNGFKKRNSQNIPQQDEHILVQIPQRREPVLIETLRKIIEFEKLHPNVKIDMLETHNGNMDKRHIDCSYFGNYIRQPEAPEGQDLIPLLDEEFIVWIDASSPLLSRDSLRLVDMENYVLPVPVGNNDGIGYLPRIYEEMFSVYDAKPNICPRYCESIDDFFLSKIKKDDLVILNPGSQAVAAINETNGRVARRFTPPLYSTAFLAFSCERQDETFVQFKKFIYDTYKQTTFR